VYVIDSSYDIQLSGFQDSAIDHTEGLMKAFGISEDRARGLLIQLPVIVKSKASGQEALKYLSALKRIGADVLVVDSDTRSPVTAADLKEKPAANVTIDEPVAPPATPPKKPRATMIGLPTRETSEAAKTDSSTPKELLDPFRVLREPDLLDLDAMMSEVEWDKDELSDELERSPQPHTFAPAWGLADELFDHASEPPIPDDPFGTGPVQTHFERHPSAEYDIGDDLDFMESFESPGSDPSTAALEPSHSVLGQQQQTVAELIRDLYGNENIALESQESELSEELDFASQGRQPTAPPNEEPLKITNDQSAVEPSRSPSSPSLEQAGPTVDNFLGNETPHEVQLVADDQNQSSTWAIELGDSPLTGRLPTPPALLAQIEDFESTGGTPLSNRAAAAADRRKETSELEGVAKPPQKPKNPFSGITLPSVSPKVLIWGGASLAAAVLIGAIVYAIASREGTHPGQEAVLAHASLLAGLEFSESRVVTLPNQGEERVPLNFQAGACYGWIATNNTTHNCDINVYLNQDGRLLQQDSSTETHAVTFSCALEDGEAELRIVNTSAAPCEIAVGNFRSASRPAWPLDPYVGLYLIQLNSLRAEPLLRQGDVQHGDLGRGQSVEQEVVIPANKCLSFLGISQQGTDLDAALWIDGNRVSGDNRMNNYPLVGSCAGATTQLGHVEFSMVSGSGPFVWQELDGPVDSSGL